LDPEGFIWGSNINSLELVAMLNNDRDDHLWALDLDALRKAFRKFAQEHDIAASEWGEQAQRFLEKQRDRTREATATPTVGNSRPVRPGAVVGGAGRTGQCGLIRSPPRAEQRIPY